MAYRKKAKPFPDNWTFQVDPNARPITYDDICLLAFNMTTEALIQDIIANKDGKWDYAYGLTKVMPDPATLRAK